jgi:hypothetical protein
MTMLSVPTTAGLIALDLRARRIDAASRRGVVLPGATRAAIGRALIAAGRVLVRSAERGRLDVAGVPR